MLPYRAAPFRPPSPAQTDDFGRSKPPMLVLYFGTPQTVENGAKIVTENRFKTESEDPEYVQLAARLMEKIASPFNKWLVDMFMEDQPPKVLVEAVCMSFATLMQLVANHTSKPGHEEGVIDAMLVGIRKMAVKDVSPPAEKPNDSHH